MVAETRRLIAKENEEEKEEQSGLLGLRPG
jgi:hypothetical protein